MQRILVGERGWMAVEEKGKGAAVEVEGQRLVGIGMEGLGGR